MMPFNYHSPSLYFNVPYDMKPCQLGTNRLVIFKSGVYDEVVETQAEEFYQPCDNCFGKAWRGRKEMII